MTSYEKAQIAISQLKGAIYEVLEKAPNSGLKNVEIGRKLGIYMGHVGHEGHISRTCLELMKQEGLLIQDEETKAWSLIK